MNKFIPSDDELLMFHYGEDLGPERTAAIGLAIADDALTGGLYSRSPRHIAAAREQFDVGNLYINRAITGLGKVSFSAYVLHFAVLKYTRDRKSVV